MVKNTAQGQGRCLDEKAKLALSLKGHLHTDDLFARHDQPQSWRARGTQILPFILY